MWMPGATSSAPEVRKWMSTSAKCSDISQPAT